MNKKIMYLFLMAIITLLPFMTINVHADEINTKNNLEKIDKTVIEPNKNKPLKEQVNDFYNENNGSAELPEVTIKQANNWVNRKGNDIINFLQNFGKPFTLGFLIFFMFVTIAGSVMKKGLTVGLIGMFCCVVCYTGIMYAPNLLNFFSTWLAS